MLRKFLFVVLFLGAIASAFADECPMGWGYTTVVDASAGGCVDLGTLDWTKYTLSSASYFATTFKQGKDNPSSARTSPIYCHEYKTVGYQNREDKSMFTAMGVLSLGNYLYIRDDRYTTATAFKQAMSGVILYYQRTTDSSWAPPRDDTVCQFDTSSYEPYGEYVLPEIHGCTLCPPNTYKDFVGNDACIPCPDGTMSPAGAKSIDQCGHILHVGNYNIFMPVGKRTEHGLCAMLDGVKYCADVYERQ